MPDLFENHQTGLESPASRAFAVTPDDGSDLPITARALCVATSGMVRATTTGGDTVTFYMAAGTAFPLRTSRVWATGTTATGIVGLA